MHGIIEAMGADERVTGEGGEKRGRPGPSCLMQGKGSRLGFPGGGPHHMLPAVLLDAVFHPQVLGKD